jgi:hypothetical protein
MIVMIKVKPSFLDFDVLFVDFFQFDSFSTHSRYILFINMVIS